MLGVLRFALGPFALLKEKKYLLNKTYNFLTAKDHLMLTAIIPVMLKTSIKLNIKEINKIINNIDITIYGLPLELQKELRELFTILQFPVTRRLLAQVWSPWSQTKENEIESFLNSWRKSKLSLLRGAYQGLNELIFASYYSQPESWKSIGYDGPPKIL